MSRKIARISKTSSIPQEVKRLLSDKLVLYQVGGSIRDEIMGLKPDDYDFTTPSVPDDIELAIKNIGRKPHIIGKRFGTVSLSVQGKKVEITTFRTEKYAKGSRKPAVSFTASLEEDLGRRDFTINAVAKDILTGKIIDLFGGKEDLKKGIIRSVGSPKSRFKEDPLRMLRAARFASQFNFQIEPYTERFMKELAQSILDVSRERWMIELNKLLLSDYPEIGLNYLMNNRLFNFMIPPLSLQKDFDQHSKYHAFTLWEHTVRVVKNTPRDLYLRWAALLHDIAKPFVAEQKKDGYLHYIGHEKLGSEMVKSIGIYLRWSNEMKDRVSYIVLHHLEVDSPLKKADNRSKFSDNGRCL